MHAQLHMCTNPVSGNTIYAVGIKELCWDLRPPDTPLIPLHIKNLALSLLSLKGLNTLRRNTGKFRPHYDNNQQATKCSSCGLVLYTNGDMGQLKTGIYR